MPTGAGKSHIAYAFAKWAAEYEKRTTILVPNGDLQRQYQAEFKSLASLWGTFSYKAPGAYQAALEAAKLGVNLMNPYVFLSHRGLKKKGLPTPDFLVIDEAHKMVDFQLDQTVKARLWKHLHDYPEMRDVADLVAWLDMKLRTAPNKVHTSARAAIMNVNQEVHLERSIQTYRGHDRECLDIRPLTARYAKPVLWDHRRTKTLVLLSATIPSQTLFELGLDRFYDVKFLQCDSPIHHAARPIYYRPIADMSMVHRDASMHVAANCIRGLLDYHAANGFIHATYDDAVLLRSLLTAPRLMWHDRESKSNTLQDFYGSNGHVLVGSGMREGIDLKGPRAHWQVITKIPFPNLGDNWTRAKTQICPEWYDAQAVQEILQACGRVCRGPDDYGSTYILDSRFERLFQERSYMFPGWFKDALRWEKQ